MYPCYNPYLHFSLSANENSSMCHILPVPRCIYSPVLCLFSHSVTTVENERRLSKRPDLQYTLQMNFGQLIHPLPNFEKSIVRRIEKISYKINAAEVAILFNECCIKEGFYPNYTNLRLHDPSAQQVRRTRNFRRSLIVRQIHLKKDERVKLSNDLLDLHNQWSNLPVFTERQPIKDALQNLKNQDLRKKEQVILRKLIRLNGGKLKIPRNQRRYINLTQYQPDAEEEDLLQMGLNCHYIDKYDLKKKRLEVEVLLDTLLSLENQGKVELSDSLQPLLLAEGLTDRSNSRSCIFNKRLRDTARRLRQAENITIRRADKTAALVLIDTNEYHTKLDEILSDQTKFQRITRNPIETIKREANRIIERVNASCTINLPPIQGDFEAGYIYGNVKTHKQGNPLRPIISQIPTPTYHLAKTLNSILTPYTPSKYCVKSSAEFLEMIKRTPQDGIIASMDVESLFTNVPVDETINLILDRVYRDNSTPNLDIPEDALRALLELCTKKAPFISNKGLLYTQIDGVAMGSPLGVLFANFYMGIIEERVFSQNPPPQTYCRYVDDTYICVPHDDDIHRLIQDFKDNSELNFTFEKSVEGALPFLDVLVTCKPSGTETSVYRKKTDLGMCLNGDSECPRKFKNSAIDAYIRRALSHCSSWHLTNQELEHCTQTLVNNGYSNKQIQKRIRLYIDRWYNRTTNEDAPPNLKLFYRAYYHRNHRQDEAALRNIIHDNVKTTDENQLKLIIYYKNKKTSQLLLKNNPSPQQEDLKKRNVVYLFQCPEVGCPHTYIGMTTTRLSKRLSCHLQEGAIKNHYYREHGDNLDRPTLTGATSIIDSANDSKRLRILEALNILQQRPSLNTTQESFLLPSMRRRRPTTVAARPSLQTAPQQHPNPQRLDQHALQQPIRQLRPRNRNIYNT